MENLNPENFFKITKVISKLTGPSNTIIFPLNEFIAVTIAIVINENLN